MTSRSSTHESLERDSPVVGSSNRAFGLVFAGACLIIMLWPVARGHGVRWWALPPAGVFLLLALLYPSALGPLNRLWTLFGLLLHRIVNPLVMGLLYYLTITPFGVVMRLMGRDLLRLQFEADAESYWILRHPPGPAPDTMRNQF